MRAGNKRYKTASIHWVALNIKKNRDAISSATEIPVFARGRELAEIARRQIQDKLSYINYGIFTGILVMLIYLISYWARQRRDKTSVQRLSIIASLNRLHDDPSVQEGHITQQYYYT